MSVINQMLKDLEQRSPEQGGANAAPIAVPEKTSTVKVVAYTVLVLLVVNAVGIYIWQLLNENTALKQQNHAKPAAITTSVNSQQSTPIKVIENKEQATAKLPSKEEVIDNSSTDKEAFAEQMAAKNMPRRELSKAQLPPVQASEQSAVEPSVSENKVAVKQVQQATNSVVNHAQVTPASKEQELQVTAKPVAKMSVSRRQLTAEELVAQKMAQAEELLAAKDIAKAEQRLEEILIISPNHIQARKKLAALWFGRKAYQKASNLLSQGIALYPQDKSLRVMKAQVHLKQQQAVLAYQSLLPLAELEDVEYQVMLANVAQQSSQWQSAIDAYKLLEKMQPSSGRWPLGLAIVYDKSSQFPLAIQAYKAALLKSGLTASSAEFAEQRIKALGE